MKYVISYDLQRPGQNYEALYNKLRRFNAKRILQSQWVFNCINANAQGLRDYFKKYLDSNDRILVNSLDGTDWAGWNLLSQVNEV